MLIYDLAFDVYPPDDPAGKVSGTGVAARLVRLTLDDQLIDGEYVAELFGSGSGFVEIHVDNPDADFLQKRGYIQVIRMTGTLWLAEEPIGGFWLSRGFLKALSSSEQVGRVVRWEGEGPSDGLDRYVLGHSVYATGQTQRGDFTQPGKWSWSDEPMGAMLVRVLEEGFDHPDGFYNFFTWDFDRTEDTNGNDWEVLSDYETAIGTSGLKLWADFLKQGLVAEVGPDLEIHAYRDLDEYRTDRSSGTFAANKVRFEAGVNILADLLKRLNASSQRTHVLYEDRIGDYETIDEDSDLNPIDGVPYMTYRKSTTTADDDAIRRMGRHFLTTLDRYVDVAKVTHPVGPGGIAGDEGYLPSPTGDYWLGDLVTIHSGTTDYDFNEQTIEVAAIRYFITGSQWMVEAELGAKYRSIQQEQAQAQIAQTVINQYLNSIALCQANATVDQGAVSLARLYFSNTASALSAITASAGWDDTAAATTDKILTTTPDGTLSSGHTKSESVSGSAGGKNVLNWQAIYGPLSTADAASIAAGGLSIRGQIRSRARDTFNSHQDLIGNIGVRVTTGATTTIRGTALAPHTLASSAGSTKWVAGTALINRIFPPAAATDVLSAVGGTAAGDYLVIELGVRNYYTGPSGSSIRLDSSESSDLPQDEVSQDALNAWVDLFTAGTTEVVSGDGRVELVGTSIKAKRCDDTEHFHAIGSDAPTDTDDVDAGFRNGTLWVNDFGTAWLLVDNSAAAAIWIRLGQVVPDYLEFAEAAAPSTPDTGYARIYAKSDGRFYSMDDAGTEYGPFDVSGGGSSTYPEIVNVANTSITANGTSHVVNLPGGLAAGELLLIVAALDGTATISASGWTALSGFAIASTGNVSLCALWKIASGSEGATVTVTSSASEKAEYQSMRIGNAHASAPIEGASAQSGTASTSHDPPSLTPSWGSDDVLWLVMAVADCSSDATQQYLRAPILGCYHYSVAPGVTDSAALAIATREFTGTVWDPTPYTPQASEQWCAGTIAIRPP